MLELLTSQQCSKAVALSHIFSLEYSKMKIEVSCTQAVFLEAISAHKFNTQRTAAIKIQAAAR